MKSFRFIYLRLVAPAILGTMLLASFNALAQIPGAGGNATSMMNAVILRLFGANTNFVSKLDVRILDKQKQETGSIQLLFERLGDKVRYDVDMTKVKSKEMSPEFASAMKEMGMDQMNIIRLPDKQVLISVYPNLKAYAEAPMDKDDLQALTNGAKIEKSRLGRETIDGHPTEKYNVTATEASGHKDNIVIWAATDMKDFPIQMQVPADETTLIFKFKDVKLGRPEFSHFEAPSGMTKYADVNALMSAAVARKMHPPQ